MEDRCSADTEACIADLGKKAPRCYEQIGTMLALVDGMASCFWSCSKGNHDVERLLGRVASDARAAIRLMKAGFYDQALMLCRSMGEFAALLALFSHQHGTLAEWRASSEAQRRKRFAPASVRQTLEGLGQPMPNEPEHYRMLSSRVVHPTPNAAPQSYNILSIPTLGGVLQREGIMLCINEIACPVGIAASYGASLLDVETSIKLRVADAANALAQTIGGAQYVDWEDFHRARQLETFGAEIRGPRDLPRT